MCLSIGWYRLGYRWVLPISMHERCEGHPKTDGLCSSEHGLWGIGFGGSPIGYAGFMSCFKVQGNFLLRRLLIWTSTNLRRDTPQNPTTSHLIHWILPGFSIPVIGWVITQDLLGWNRACQWNSPSYTFTMPVIGVISPVTHLFSASYRGETTLVITCHN